jgi:hypothetical protein
MDLMRLRNVSTNDARARLKIMIYIQELSPR